MAGLRPPTINCRKSRWPVRPRLCLPAQRQGPCGNGHLWDDTGPIFRNPPRPHPTCRPAAPIPHDGTQAPSAAGLHPLRLRLLHEGRFKTIERHRILSERKCRDASVIVSVTPRKPCASAAANACNASEYFRWSWKATPIFMLALPLKSPNAAAFFRFPSPSSSLPLSTWYVPRFKMLCCAPPCSPDQQDRFFPRHPAMPCLDFHHHNALERKSAKNDTKHQT